MPNATRPLVWVLDDSAADRRLAQAALDADFRLELFATVESLLDRLQALNRPLSPDAKPALLVCDLHMPEARGDDLYLQIARALEAHDIAFVLLTGQMERDVPRNLLRAGADAVLHKPMTAQLTVQQLRAVLNQRRATLDLKAELSDRRAVLGKLAASDATELPRNPSPLISPMHGDGGMPELLQFDHAGLQFKASRTAFFVAALEIQNYRALRALHAPDVISALLVDFRAALWQALPAGAALAVAGAGAWYVTSQVDGDAQRGVMALTELLRQRALQSPQRVKLKICGGWIRGDAEDTLPFLRQRALSALREAKRANAPVLVVESTEAPDQQRRALAAEAALAGHWADDRFFLQQQGEYALGSGHLVGAESLLLWRSPDDSALDATQLSSAAARLGRQHELDWIRVEKTIAAAGQQLPKIADPQFCWGANCQVATIAQPQFQSRIARALASASVPPERIVLELTESDVVSADVPMREALRTLQQQGIGLALDDFGVGQSALALLRDLGVRQVKLSAHLVSGLRYSARVEPIIASIVEWGQRAQYQTLALDVVSDEQRRRLIALGVSLGQGTHFSPWESPEAFLARCG